MYEQISQFGYKVSHNTHPFVLFNEYPITQLVHVDADVQD